MWREPCAFGNLPILPKSFFQFLSICIGNLAKIFRYFGTFTCKSPKNACANLEIWAGIPSQNENLWLQYEILYMYVNSIGRNGFLFVLHFNCLNQWSDKNLSILYHHFRFNGFQCVYMCVCASHSNEEKKDNVKNESKKKIKLQC